MFTFGREHEKKSAVYYLSDQKHAALIEAVIDSVHDLIDGTTSQEAVRLILKQAFTEGGSGVWEQTAIWLRKLSAEYPDFESLWIEFANHPEWNVRFRAACCLDEMPASVVRQVSEKLMQDDSKKVREMAQEKS